MSRVRMNVSGTYFEFESNILDKDRNRKLVDLLSQAGTDGQYLQVTVDRSPESFSAILSYYQTGELHMPTTVCPAAFRKELEYWGVSETELHPCCLYRYHSFFDELETQMKFKEESVTQNVLDNDFVAVSSGCTKKNLRRRVWNIIDYQEKSLISKAYLVLVFLMVVLCILILALSTEPSLQRHLKKCELLEYLQYSHNEFADEARERFDGIDCTSGFFQPDDEINEDDYTWYESVYDDNTTDNITPPPIKVSLPNKTVRLFVFEVLEMFTATFFTLDLLLRLLTCPSVRAFFTSVLNIFDILALVGFYAHLAVVNVKKDLKYEVGWVRLIDFLQTFRVLRLFRIVKTVPASRVLSYSLRQNARDMTLLVLLVVIVATTSASLIYLIESRETIPSIPTGWYWAMITLTTVGYGDLTPKTGSGRVLAVLLAICGILLLAATVPIFVNNFITLYQYSCIHEYTEKRRKKNEKEICLEQSKPVSENESSRCKIILDEIDT